MCQSSFNFNGISILQNCSVSQMLLNYTQLISRATIHIKDHIPKCQDNPSHLIKAGFLSLTHVRLRNCEHLESFVQELLFYLCTTFTRNKKKIWSNCFKSMKQLEKYENSLTKIEWYWKTKLDYNCRKHTPWRLSKKQSGDSGNPEKWIGQGMRMLCWKTYCY